MSERKPPRNHRTDEIIKAFDREQSRARDLSRQHTEATQSSHERDRQVFIERRRHHDKESIQLPEAVIVAGFASWTLPVALGVHTSTLLTLRAPERDSYGRIA